MISPISGKKMSIKKELKSYTFRKESFETIQQFYHCETSGESFMDEQLTNISLLQVYNQYRQKYSLPFPEEIKVIRTMYGLPATKMSEILGFGINSYRNYENGEVPSHSNGKMIQLIKNPKQFKLVVELSEVLDAEKKTKLISKIDKLIAEQVKNAEKKAIENYLIGNSLPNKYNGYTSPNFEKLREMVVYFAGELQPWKTKLNKLLFYADFITFKKTCFSMSGTSYRAIQMGPVPNNYNSLFEYMCNTKQIEIQKTKFAEDKIGEQFTLAPNKVFNPMLFSELELDVLKEVANRFKRMKTKDIIEYSHKELAWKENEKNHDLISYDYAFEIK